MKKFLLGLSCGAISLLMMLSLFGCGSRSYDKSVYDSASSAAAAPAAPNPNAAPLGGKGMMLSANADAGRGETAPVPAPTPAIPDPEPRKLVKNGDLTLETKEFDAAIPEIVRLVEQAGGYIERQTTQGKSLRSDGDYYERTANLTARVPADKLSTITTTLGTLCNIAAQSESVNDITDRYYDAAAHLEMLKVQETRLLELLGKAETLDNIIQLEQALTNCQYEIESLTGQLRRMDSQVAYSVLNIRIDEVVEYNVPQQTPKNFLERLGDAFVRSGKNLARVSENILFFLIIDGPVLAVYLLFFGVIGFLIYRLLRHRRKKAVAKLTPPAPESKPEDGNSNLL